MILSVQYAIGRVIKNVNFYQKKYSLWTIFSKENRIIVVIIVWLVMGCKKFWLAEKCSQIIVLLFCCL